MTRLATIDRDGVLDSAEALIAQDGPGSLTLDALAARTGVSKGGLQYVFKSKEGLIRAMLQRVVDQSAERADVALKEPDVAKRLTAWMKSLVEFTPAGAHSALLAAIVQNPKLLKDAAVAYRAQLSKIAGDDLPLERVIAISLAADGLIFGEMVGFVRLTPSERKRVVNEIVLLASLVGGNPAKPKPRGKARRARKPD